MKTKLLAIAALLVTLCGATFPAHSDSNPLTAQAERVTITRDDWGIAHVQGHTDADAVFGMMYAQAEDDFNRIDANCLVNPGRLAEAEGERATRQDLRQRLFITPATLQTSYAKSPAWLQKLMQAWDDG